MPKLSRREFIGATIGSAAIAGAGVLIGKRPHVEESIVAGSASIDRSINKANRSSASGQEWFNSFLWWVSALARWVGHTRLIKPAWAKAFTRLIRHSLDSALPSRPRRPIWI